jgi:hypothetical protein
MSDYRLATDAVVRALSGDPHAVVDALTRRMHHLATGGELEAAATARDQRATVRGVLAHQRLLAWLRASGTLRVLTASGVVELHDGRLTLADDPDHEQSGTATSPRADVHLEELVVVARWLGRQVATGRAHVIPSVTAPLPPELTGRCG